MGGSPSSQEMENEEEYSKPWRDTPWGKNENLEKTLKEFKLGDPNVKHLRILVIGEIGAGKSSFINSVNSVFQRRITNEALVNKTTNSRTFTKIYKTYYMRNEQSLLPFVLTDTMGLESGDLQGIHPEDIVKVMEGCVKERYKFNAQLPVSPQDGGYQNNPSLQDKTYCVVYIMAADKISMMNENVIQKMTYIKNKATELEIPQVIVMTRVDQSCPVVKKNLKKIYTSKRIKEKMERCSEFLGISMSHIFPVKCYHEEIDTQKDIDVLILRALTQIVHVANDALTMKHNERSSNEFMFVNSNE